MAENKSLPVCKEVVVYIKNGSGFSERKVTINKATVRDIGKIIGYFDSESSEEFSFDSLASMLATSATDLSSEDVGNLEQESFFKLTQEIASLNNLQQLLGRVKNLPGLLGLNATAQETESKS